LFFVWFLTNNSWSQIIPPTLTATGNQFYCPLEEINIVTDFNISNPDNVLISTIFIQISTGYINGEDLLKYIGTNSNITSQSFNSLEGKLVLDWAGIGVPNDSELIAAVKNVVFLNNSSTPSGIRTFSITIGQANYLPSTNHYYEYVSNIGITWQNAKVAAEGRNYYGLKGYLATITSPEEAQLSGEQAAGAGWIGGTDEGTEGVWKWATGPETGTIFWNGGINGTTPNFAFWNSNEPNNLGNEDYAHVTAPGVGISGSWNDLSNTGGTSGDYQPKGYIVEYGGTPGDPILNISASTLVSIAEISTTTPSSNCGTGTVNLAATASSGTILWFDSLSGGTKLWSGNSFTTPSISVTTTYYVLASADGLCETGKRTPVVASIHAIPTILPSMTLKNCDVDGIPDGFTDYNLNEANNIITFWDASLSVTFHLTPTDANNGINSINPSPFNNINAILNTVYARVENSFGCYSVSTVSLDVSTTTFPPGFNYEIENCDADNTIDGLFLFDFTDATQYFLAQLPPQNLSVHYYRNLIDAQLEQNEISQQNAYKSEMPFSQTLYVRIENDDNGDCFGIGEHLTLTVSPRPEFEVIPTAVVCLNSPPITLETFNAKGIYTYEWTDELNTVISTLSTASISSGGIYTVVATSSLNCESFPQTVSVTESIIATITIDDISISDASENNSITINTSNLGIGNYEFALDDKFNTYQDEPLFENVAAGIHTIYIQDKNDCGIAQIDISVIGFPKFFTPNNDGVNDTWQIKGVNSNFFQNLIIYIFDRYGKIVTKIDLKSEGWDGNLNGEALPSTDYWYSAQLTDLHGNIREKKGHFSLVRR